MKHTAEEYEKKALHAIEFNFSVAHIYATLALAAATEEQTRKLERPKSVGPR